jgi:hypothetical protein
VDLGTAGHRRRVADQPFGSRLLLLDPHSTISLLDDQVESEVAARSDLRRAGDETRAEVISLAKAQSGSGYSRASC